MTRAPILLSTLATLGILQAAAAFQTQSQTNPFPITPVPPSVSKDPFYRKQTLASGLPVIGSGKVSDAGLREAAYLIAKMIGDRPDIRDAMLRNKVRCIVMAYDERTTDIPEHSKMTPKDFWDVRARGLGATKHNPAVSCAEENLLGYEGDPYKGENILIHEFAHAIHGLALVDLDPTFEKRLADTLDSAIAAGLWKGTYGASNPAEYWAELVQCWFDCNLNPPDFQHNDIHTREQLKKYDPKGAALVAEVFGDRPWRYVLPKDRPRSESAHLAGYDPATAPKFSWGAAKKKYDEVVAEKKRKREEESKRKALSNSERKPGQTM